MPFHRRVLRAAALIAAGAMAASTLPSATAAPTPPTAAGTPRAPLALVAPDQVGQVVPVPTRRLWSSGARGLPAGQSATVQVTGRAGLPASQVRAVFVTVTASDAASDGRVSVGTPGSAGRVVAAPLRRGHLTSGSVLVRPDADGRIQVRTTARARVLLDVTAYVMGPRSGTAGPGGLTAVPGIRRLDTRTGLGGPAMRAGRLRTVPVTGRGGVPSTGVSAVVATVTLLPRSGGTGLAGVNAEHRSQRWAMGRSQGTTPIVVTTVLPVSQRGRVAIRTTAVADARLDVVGWVRAAPLGAAYATMPGGLAPVSEHVLVGRQHRGALVRPGSPETVRALGAGAVPDNVGGVVLAITTSTTRGRRGGVSVGTPGDVSRIDPVPVSGAPTRRLEFVRSDRAGEVVVSATGSPVRVRTSIVAYLPAQEPRQADQQVPEIAIDSPTDGEAVHLGDDGEFTISGTAVDDGSGIARVEILADDVLVGTTSLDTSTVPARWSAATPAPAGPVRLSAVAVDHAGNRAATSVSVVIAVPTQEATVVTPRTVVTSQAMQAAAREYQDGRIVLAGGTWGLDAGDILVSVPIPGVADQGFLVRILAVDVRDGDTLLATEQAQFDDVFVQADFEQVSTVAMPDPQDRARPAVNIAASFPLTLKKEIGKVGEIELGGQVKIEGWLKFEVDVYWDWFKSRPYVSLFDVGWKTTAEASIGITAKAAWEPVFPIASVPLPAIAFFVGPIPVVITTRANFDFYAKFGITGTVKLSAVSTNESSATYRGNQDGGSWSHSGKPQSVGREFSGSLKGTAEAGLRITLSMLLYDLAGPGVEVAAGAQVSGGRECKASTSITGKYECESNFFLGGVASGAIKIKVQIAGYTLGEQRWELVRVTYPICAYPVRPGYSVCPFVKPEEEKPA